MQITDATQTSDLIGRNVIEIYTVFTVANVVQYEFMNYNTWSLTTSPTGSPTSVCLVIDTLYDDAFSHWVFESAIYLPLFTILKHYYFPFLKLVLKSRKQYKRLFCTYFGISDDDIVYEVPAENQCFFPSPISSLNDNAVHPDYLRQLDAFWDMFKAPGYAKSVSVLVLPRQSRENYAGNDRIIDSTAVVAYTKRIPNSAILHTDDVTDLCRQLHTVRSANVIVVDFGSSWFVNGMFSYDADVVVHTGIYTNEHTAFNKLNVIVSKIAAQNKSQMLFPNPVVRIAALR